MAHVITRCRNPLRPQIWGLMCCDACSSDDGFYFQHIPRIVHLSVGGTGFSTSLFTLTKDDSTVFARMFSGRVPLAQDEQGRYFIDRSPAHFEIILEYLRDGFCELPSDPAKLRQIWREADFYQLEGLKALIPPHIFSATPQMTANNVIQRSLTTHDDRLIPSLDLLLEFAFGEPSTGLSFSRTCTVNCKIWGYGADYVCPGRFAMMREEGYVRGPAKSMEYSRSAETVMNAPGWVGGNYDAHVYGRPGEEWPADLKEQNKLVFDNLEAKPLCDPQHASLKSSILTVANCHELAQVALCRVYGFGPNCKVEMEDRKSAKFPSGRLMDEFSYTVAKMKLHISWA